MRNIKRNQSIRFSVILIFVICLLAFGKINGQKSNDIIIELSTTQIDCSNFNDSIWLYLTNSIEDTLFIAVEPFYSNLYSSKEKPFSYLSLLSDTYSPSMINFFEKNVTFNCSVGINRISYNKFPKILCLFPKKKIKISLNISNVDKEKLKNSIWDLKYEIWYAYKSELTNELIKKPDFLIKEFNNAIINFDCFNIDFNSIRSMDSTLFIYKDGKKIDYRYESIYDSIIIKYFIHSINN